MAAIFIFFGIPLGFIRTFSMPRARDTDGFKLILLEELGSRKQMWSRPKAKLILSMCISFHSFHIWLGESPPLPAFNLFLHHVLKLILGFLQGIFKGYLCRRRSDSRCPLLSWILLWPPLDLCGRCVQTRYRPQIIKYSGCKTPTNHKRARKRNRLLTRCCPLVFFWKFCNSGLGTPKFDSSAF